MSSNIERQLAKSQRSLLVAPAGCGKTETIARAVGISSGRQLVLTHTHAGVRALRSRLRALGISTDRWRVDTIDGFSLRYALYFPRHSGFPHNAPSGSQWNELRNSTIRAFQRKALQRFVKASYTGVFVDEYQDCTLPQHHLVLALASLLPVRIVADPLQGVFGPMGADFDWHHHVAPHFDRLPNLATPWRWRNANADLGGWLDDVRQVLLEGGTVDWQTGPLTWHHATHENQRKSCFHIARLSGNDTVIAVRQRRPQCYKFAQSLGGAFTAMEEMDCSALTRASRRIESKHGLPRVLATITFASECLTGLTPITSLIRRVRTVEDLASAAIARTDLACHIRAIAESDCMREVRSLLKALQARAGTRNYRRELWDEMIRALDAYDRGGFGTLSEAAIAVRQRTRVLGRPVYHRSVSTPLLIKGLEFDHSIVLNADELTAKELYVALTRGSKSLTVLSSNPVKLIKPTEIFH